MAKLICLSEGAERSTQHKQAIIGLSSVPLSFLSDRPPEIVQIYKQMDRQTHTTHARAQTYARPQISFSLAPKMQLQRLLVVLFGFFFSTVDIIFIT